jgi:hypothetical protein
VVLEMKYEKAEITSILQERSQSIYWDMSPVSIWIYNLTNVCRYYGKLTAYISPDLPAAF